MEIEKVSLNNFRNLEQGETEFSPGLNVIFGDNAQGKTSLLEGIFMCSSGKSHRARLNRELIRFGQREAHIRVILKKSGRHEKIDVHLKSDGKKGIAVNGMPIKKYGELFGVFLTVIFSPEELGIVKNEPGDRRRFMDLELCQLNPVYYHSLRMYYKVLKHRNSLLKDIQRGAGGTRELMPWDAQLVEYGRKIILIRRKFISRISSFAGEIHKELTGGTGLTIKYLPNSGEDELESRLSGLWERDIAQGATGVGPHRDDLSFLVNDRDLRIYGSQGEVRSASIAAKLSEIELIKEETGEEPVLLLDDVFSELDDTRQRLLIKYLRGLQIILTCAGTKNMDIPGNPNMLRVKNGRVSQEIRPLRP